MQSGTLTHAEQEVAVGRALLCRAGTWGSRSQLQSVLAQARDALPQLSRAKEDSIPEITPPLCLHGREHVGSIERDTFFFSF